LISTAFVGGSRLYELTI